mmetsp:Transcript_30077/g.71573  ORF Transcript_30077/g.71573 Transcript_30077/m.71573 type:complete len:580 (-) Transcript_30077:403-2142(-)
MKSNPCVCNEESIPDQVEQVVESVKVLELSDDALFILKRMQDRNAPSSASSSSTEPPGSTDLPSPEAMLTAEQRLHYLRLALAAPELSEKRLKVKTADRSPRHQQPSLDSSASSSEEPPPILRSLVLATGLVEGLDVVALPAATFSLCSDMDISLQNLAVLALSQALCRAVALPFWAGLADSRTANRKTLLALGILLQGVITCSFVAVDSLVFLLPLCCVNAFATSSLRAITLGLVAEVGCEQWRGRMFGGFFCAKHLGLALGCFFSPWLSLHRVFWLEGWRLPVLATGFLSMLVGSLVALLMREPTCEEPTDVEPGCRAELWRLLRYCQIPSFLLIVFQGCFTCAAWAAMGYHSLLVSSWGLSSTEVVALRSMAQAAVALGALGGGLLTDLASRCFPAHGRQIIAQVSVCLTLPICFCAFVPRTVFAVQASLVCLLGFTSAWGNVACLPLLSELALTGRKSGMLAWHAAIEGAAGVTLATVMGVIVPQALHHSLPAAQTAATFAVQQIVFTDISLETSVLEEPHHHAVFAMVAAFWGLALCCYSLLHWSFPRDWRRARQSRAHEAEQFWTLRSQRVQV